jgi:hypothetical protein
MAGSIRASHATANAELSLDHASLRPATQAVVASSGRLLTSFPLRKEQTKIANDKNRRKSKNTGKKNSKNDTRKVKVESMDAAEGDGGDDDKRESAGQLAKLRLMVEALWDELRVPMRDRRAVLRCAPSELFGRLASHADALLIHRARTLAALARIEEREQALASLRAFLINLSNQERKVCPGE